jgi:two-component system, NarL family, nitrate/nitrite response regulator NarL
VRPGAQLSGAVQGDLVVDRAIFGVQQPVVLSYLRQEARLMREISSATKASCRHSAPCVLIVEDNPEFLFHLSEAIRGLGSEWRIQTARTASDAILLIKGAAYPYRLALVDIGLPDRSGIDVIRALSAGQPDVPVLVVSILSTEDVVLTSIRAGVRGYLLKDDSASTIRDAITQVLNDQYPISPALARYLFRLVKSPPENAGIPPLTARELDVLVALSQGMTYPEIADSLDLSISTIRTHIQKIYRKLNARTGSEAVALAKNNQLI